MLINKESHQREAFPEWPIWLALMGNNWVLFSHGPQFTIYFEFKFRFFKKQKLFSIEITEFGAYSLWNKKAEWFLLLLKEFSWETDLLVTLYFCFCFFVLFLFLL